MAMEIINIAQVNSREEWRAWLKANHATEKFCWVRSKRGMWGTGKKDGDGLDYLDLVEEALCYGWIDRHKCKGLSKIFATP